MTEKILESLEIKTGENTSDKYLIPYNALANRPDLSVYAKLAGGNTLSGNQVITDYLDIRGTAAEKHLKTRGIGGSDGNGNSSDLYLQYSSNYKTYFGNTAQSSLNADGSISINGKTAATTDQIPAAANNGTLTIQKNGTTVQTFTANQSSSVIANITVPTKASDVNALSLDGGTINKSKTIKMDASANSDGANLKWGTVKSKNPYIGYASDQVDGTFVVGSLLGTNYASGLAIGGGSGNLLWKGTKVATISDIPNVSGKANLNGGNTFTGNQHFNNGQCWFNDTLGIEDKDTNSLMTLDNNGFNLDVDGFGGVPFMIAGNAGTSGQVLTSQGAGKTPQWTTPTKGTVTQVKVNGTTKSPNAAGLVDLGTIGGGGGGGAKTYRDFIYADDITTIFENNEYGNAFIFASNDCEQGSRQTYSIYVNQVKTYILTSDPVTDYVDKAVCINISRINGGTPYSFINVNVFYKNTLKTIHIDDVSNSTIDLRYTDDANQSSSLYLNITKGTT